VDGTYAEETQNPGKLGDRATRRWDPKHKKNARTEYQQDKSHKIYN